MNSGRIHQDNLRASSMDDAQDAVSCRLRFFGNDGNLGADQRIEQRAFPGVRTADDGDKSGPKNGGFMGHENQERASGTSRA